MKTAAIYIRVSTDKQEELSPDAQKRLIIKYAKEHNILVNKEYIYIENGISGRNAEKRPEFQKMIATAKSKPKPFDVILLWKFSRFARNQDESAFYKGILRKKCGIDIVSITEPITEGMYGRLIEMIIEWNDEFYSYNLAQEVRRGMEEKALRGGIQVAAPFGYSKKPGQPMVINENEAKWIVYMFEQFVAGKGLWTIANDLRKYGVVTKRGNPFENRTVEYILHNPMYIGKVRWTPTGRTLSRRIYDSKDTIISDGDHEPIISESLFNEAQLLLAERKKQKKKYAKPASIKKHWLSGMVKCSTCGGSLTFQRSNGFFQCCNYAHCKCNVSHSISEQRLSETLLSAIESVTIDKAFVKKNVTVTPTSDVTNLEKELKKLEKLLDRAKYAYLEEIDTIEEYKENKAKINSQIKEVKNKLEKEKATKELPSVNTVKIIFKDAVSVIKDESKSVEERNNALSSILEKAVYFKDTETLDIFFRL